MTQSAIGNRQSAIPPALRTDPRTCTAAQRKHLVLAASARGLDVDELRGLAGGPLHGLSSADASALIQRLSGEGLPHPPGQAPRPYGRRRGREARRHEGTKAAPRIITQSHVDQIARLLRDHFGGNAVAASAWFEHNWKVKEPRDLLTTARAGQVVAVLKEMVARRARQEAEVSS